MLRIALSCAVLVMSIGCAPAPPRPDGAARATEHDVLLLGGQLTARVPAGARLQAREVGIMAAQEPDERETRVVLVESGDHRVVLVANEMFAVAGADLEGDIRRDLRVQMGDDPYGLERLAVAAPLKAYAVVPKTARTADEANLVLGVYVAGADRTVKLLAFFASPASARNGARTLALARSVATSLGAGPRALSLEGGARRFPGDGKDTLVLTVPRGFAATAQPGPDFSVYSVSQVVSLGQPGAGVTIYLGGHPAFQHEQAGIALESVTRTAGPLLGAEREWRSWSRDGRKVEEAMAPYPGAEGLVLHVFSSTRDEKAMGSLRAIAESLRVERGSR